jgi:hypothetical protein
MVDCPQPQRQSKHTLRCLSLGLVLITQGCVQDCVGAGCLEDFGAASALLHLGSTQPSSGEHPPSEASLSVTGSAFLGAEWDIAIRSGVLIVGSSNDSTVRSYRPEIDDALSEKQAKGELVGEHSQDAFGHRVIAIPTADGSTDLLVTAPNLSITPDTRHNGGIYRFEGIGEGWEGELDSTDAVLRMTGESPGGRLGDAIAICPDIDGDGQMEWMSAATRDGSEAKMAGQVVLALSTDLVDQPDQLGIGAVETRWTGTDLAERAGHSLDCSHDLDGDGTPDLLIGSPFADDDDDTDAVGAVSLLSGATLPATGPFRPAATAVFQIGEANDWFGWSLASGDIDGDGITDLAIGAPGTDGATGAVYIWSGDQLATGDTETPTRTLLGVEDGGRFGWSTHIADFNGDGVGDLLVGAPYVNPTDERSAFDAGRISVYFGNLPIEDWPIGQNALDAPLIYTEPDQYLRTGRRIFSGDFDGDTAADMVFLHRVEGS